VSWQLTVAASKTIVKNDEENDDDAQALDVRVRDGWGCDVALCSFGSGGCG
jgi:hypothetical protein